MNTHVLNQCNWELKLIKYLEFFYVHYSLDCYKQLSTYISNQHIQSRQIQDKG